MAAVEEEEVSGYLTNYQLPYQYQCGTVYHLFRFQRSLNTLKEELSEAEKYCEDVDKELADAVSSSDSPFS